MATLEYKTGNGYSCSCCGRWEYNSFTFFDEEDAITDALYYAECADYDFDVVDIIDYDGDEEELRNKIDTAVQVSLAAYTKRRKISQLQEDIKDDERWFDKLDDLINSRQQNLERKRRELAELLEQ